MRSSDYIVVFITVSASREADSIAGELVSKKLAACVNIVPGIKSLFTWKGKVDKANELLLVVKTRKALFKELVKLVKKIHSYDVPEIIALPIIDGSRDYLKWIDEVCRKQRRKA